jgi:branched-chain amino acid transport system substrate-binding protein
MDLLLKSSVASLIVFGLLLFTRNAVSQQPVHIAESIKIGLLIPDTNSIAAVNGARLAIRSANRSGGFNVRQFELLVRPLSGPWGTGSKQAVSLIFDEKVWVLLGSHDGRNAHLVEQAATKARIVFMSAWAGDPTLSQAFVPWFFNSVPNDNKQATAITAGIFKGPSGQKTAVISDDGYDSGSSLKSFLATVSTAGRPAPLQLSWKECGEDPGIVADKLTGNGINTLVILCQPKTAVGIVSIISEKNLKIKIFGSLSLLNEDELSPMELRTFNEKLIVPSGAINSIKIKAFAAEYERAFGKEPGEVAAVAFDAMNILIEAIRKAGTSDRERIQDALKNIHYEGVTGTFGFDEKGNRNDRIGLVNVKDGLPSGTYN